MKAERFIYFFTVSGFFIGLSFSVLNFRTAEDIFIYTLEITLFFYLFIHLILVYFVDSEGKIKRVFHKDYYEKNIDDYIHEIEERENKINSIIQDIETKNSNLKQEAGNS